MHVLKAGGSVYGASLSAAERKALDIEVKKMLSRDLVDHANEVDAIILYVLGRDFGFGPVRMRRLWERVHEEYQELCSRYDMTPQTEEGCWIVQKKLLEEKGVDIAAWNKEQK